jgi:hypothetical protein
MFATGTAPAALFIASWLAQAEQAPPEPAPPRAAPTVTEAPPPPASSLALHGRFAYRPGDSVGPAPAAGFSIGATVEHRYALLGGLLGLGVAIDFFHDHFAADQQFVTSSQQLLTQTSFAALQTVSVTLGRVRPWVAGGGGLSFAYFSGTGLTDMGTPLPGVSDNELLPVVRTAAGLDVTVRGDLAIVVRADYTHPLSRPTFGGFASSPFGDLVDAGVGVLFRF